VCVDGDCCMPETCEQLQAPAPDIYGRVRERCGELTTRCGTKITCGCAVGNCTCPDLSPTSPDCAANSVCWQDANVPCTPHQSGQCAPGQVCAMRSDRSTFGCITGAKVGCDPLANPTCPQDLSCHGYAADRSWSCTYYCATAADCPVAGETCISWSEGSFCSLPG
jgi:hypothetical protein